MKQTQRNDKAMGVFTLMCEWPSYEIANWLDVTTPNVARALFETGANMEAERAALLTISERMAQIVEILNQPVQHSNTITPNAIKILRADAETAKLIAEQSLSTLANIRKQNGGRHE